MKPMLLALAVLAFSPHAVAEKLSLGSMELKTCSRGKERATLVLEIEAPNFKRVQAELKDCAVHGVAIATLPGLVRNLPGATAAFWQEFALCTRYTEWAKADLSVEMACR